MKLKLYHARWSLCSQMVRVALEEKGLSYESNLIKLCDQYPEAENLSPEYLAINPKGIVPSLDLDGEIVTESTNIIKKLNSISGEIDIDLWPVDADQEKLNTWVEDTTLTDGVPLGKTLGTAIPPFSLILINFMVKKYLSIFQAIKVFWKHPLRERGRFFLVMKFFNIQKPVAARYYKALSRSLLDIEKHLENSGPYFLGKFSHIDINLMCCFHRLSDVKLEKILEIDELPNIKKYWELLKSRESYKKGVLEFYGDKEYGDIKELFGSNTSMHLIPLKKMIKNFSSSIN
jgi:glutathione S-transferase